MAPSPSQSVNRSAHLHTIHSDVDAKAVTASAAAAAATVRKLSRWMPGRHLPESARVVVIKRWRSRGQVNHYSNEALGPEF